MESYDSGESLQRHRAGVSATLRPGAASSAPVERDGLPLVRPVRYVVRTWHRDGSTNIMDLERAAESLAQFHPSKTLKQLISALWWGDTLSSNRATFKLYRPNERSTP